MDSEATKLVGGRMVEHMLQFARGINEVLEHEGAEAYLLENPAEVDALQKELSHADCALNRVRQISLWRKGGEGGEDPLP